MVLVLLALWGGATWFKATRVVENAQFSRSDDTAMFWGQDALRYRYAKILAAGMALPAQDKALGWPKGQDTYAEDSWVMEKLAAIAYREVVLKISVVPFHVFLWWWWSALTTLAIWPIYALSRRVWNQRLAGIASACLWASAFGGLHATAGPRLAVTDVALPWLFLTVHFFVTAGGRPAIVACAGGSGLLLVDADDLAGCRVVPAVDDGVGGGDRLSCICHSTW